MTVTAGNIMDRAAALLSDPSKATFSYTLQLPFLVLAWDELQEELVANDILDLQENTSSPISVSAGVKDLTSGQPADLLFPEEIWERAVGGADADWVKMTEEVPDPADPQVETLDVWYWEENLIKFRGATTAREIKIRYQRDLVTLVDQSTILPVTNAKLFLSYRTAAIIAESRGNKLRAVGLSNRADLFLAKAMTTKVKDMQDTPARPKRYGSSRRRRRN